MNVIIICLLSIGVLLPFWDYSLTLKNYISFIPFIIYSIILFLFDKFKNQEKTNSSVDITTSDIYKAFLFNFLFFVLFVFIFFLLIKLLPNIFSKNILLLFYLILFTQNTGITSPGFFICKIFVENLTFKKRLLLLINNFYKYLIFYIGLFPKSLRESKYGIAAISFIFLFYIINLFYRFLISKKYSFVEHLLKITYRKRLTEKLESNINTN